MTTTPGPIELITLEELKQILGIPLADHSNDLILQGLIQHSSAHVQALLLGADGFGLGPEERVDTYRSEEPRSDGHIFLAPIPGPLYDIVGNRSRVPSHPLDLSSLNFVVDQVRGWARRFQEDSQYAKSLERDLENWRQACRRHQEGSGRPRRYAYVRTVATHASNHELNPNWGFELRFCVYLPPGRGRLEGILSNPRTGKGPSVRFDILFPAEPISALRAPIPPGTRKSLRRFAIPVVHVGEDRSREDILAELLIASAAFFGPDAIDSFNGAVFEWFKRYARRFRPKAINLMPDDLDSITYDVLAHLCRNYGPTGSGRIFPRYLKFVLRGYVMQHLKARGVESISAGNVPIKNGKDLGIISQEKDGDVPIVPGFSTVGYGPADGSPLTVLQAQAQYGIPRDFIYDAVRKGTITVRRVPGEAMRLDRNAIDRLKQVRAEIAKRKLDADRLASEHGILRKSAMRALQRRRKRCTPIS